MRPTPAARPAHTVYTAPMQNPIYPMVGIPMPPQQPPPPPQSSNGGGSSEDTDSRKLFVRGLSWETSNDALRAEFLKYGELEEASVARDRKTGKSKGFGFVTFTQKASADRALQQPQKVIEVRRTGPSRRKLLLTCYCAAGTNHNVQSGLPGQQQGPRQRPQQRHGSHGFGHASSHACLRSADPTGGHVCCHPSPISKWAGTGRSASDGVRSVSWHARSVSAAPRVRSAPAVLQQSASASASTAAAAATAASAVNEWNKSTGVRSV